MALYDRFLEFLTEHSLARSGDRILLAVSGGVDSVVMTHLFVRAQLAVGIAHCNFQLRGAASDGDEDFVRDMAEAYSLPVFVEVFDTSAEAVRQGVSIQMAARELRYQWLEEVRQLHGYDRIATGHVLTDSIETFFYNFAKGAGLRGLHGIPVRRDAIVRPLLFATKEEVLYYARELGLSFREDVTNAEEVYARNKIRHRILPVLQELNPSFETTAASNLERLREAEYLFELALDQIRQEVLRSEGERLLIDIDRLLFHYRAAGTILYELLHPFHFHPGQIAQILAGTGRQPGALFFSASHQLLVDREALIVEPRILDSEEKLYYIAEEIDTLYLPNGKLTLTWHEGRPDSFPDDPNRALLQAAPLEFPLCVRHWRQGDFFYPFGMNGRRQKLQDFFTNRKISRVDKNRVWLLETSRGDICWVVGMRIDHRFRVTPQADQYVEVTFYPA